MSVLCNNSKSALSMKGILRISSLPGTIRYVIPILVSKGGLTKTLDYLNFADDIAWLEVSIPKAQVQLTTHLLQQDIYKTSLVSTKLNT